MPSPSGPDLPGRKWSAINSAVNTMMTRPNRSIYIRIHHRRASRNGLRLKLKLRFSFCRRVFEAMAETRRRNDDTIGIRLYACSSSASVDVKPSFSDSSADIGHGPACRSLVRFALSGRSIVKAEFALQGVDSTMFHAKKLVAIALLCLCCADAINAAESPRRGIYLIPARSP